MTRIDEVHENYHAKRAIEIAIAGKHSIAFVGGNADGDKLLEVAHSYGLKAYRVKTCPCGNFRSPTEICECEWEAIEAWQQTPEYKQAMSADIVIEVQWYTKDDTRHSEPDEVILRRIANIKPAVPECYDNVTRSLIVHAFQKYFAGTGRLPVVIKLAQTIARLSWSDDEYVKCAYIAEAMQYQPMRERLITP